MNRARAVRYDNGDMEKEIAAYDISQTHEVYQRKNRSQAHSYIRNYNNRFRTENGAWGLKTTQHELLDMHFQISSLRMRKPEYITDSFVKAYYENPHYAVKWLFYLRDIAQGLGAQEFPHLYAVSGRVAAGDCPEGDGADSPVWPV